MATSNTIKLQGWITKITFQPLASRTASLAIRLVQRSGAGAAATLDEMRLDKLKKKVYGISGLLC
jgi:hypothetical protein